MKNLLFVLIGFAIFSTSFAQDLEYQVSRGEVKRDKITKRTYGIEPVAEDNRYVYYLYLPYMAVYGEISHGSVENYFLAKFRKDDLTEVNKQELELEFDNRKRQFHGLFHLDNSFYLFSGFQNEQHKKHYLFVQTIDKESLVAEDNMRMIGEIDYSGFNKYSTTYFNYAFSPDSSKVLVYYNLVNKDNENLRYGMYVYSNEMELLWKKENVVPKITAGVFSFQKFRIANDGSVYLKGTNYTNLENYYASANFKERGFFSKDTYYADYPNYTIQLYKYTSDGEDRQMDIELPGKFVRSLTFLPMEDGHILGAGIYSAPGTISARGSFSFDLDMDNHSLGNVQSKEFDNELMEAGLDEKQLKRFRNSAENSEEWDPFEYQTGDIKTGSNGEKYFIAEQSLRGTKVEKSGNMVVYKTIFMNHDLFIINLDASNAITGINKIKKRQYLLTTNQYNSYAVFEKEGSLFFLFKEYLKKDTMFKNAEMGNTWLVKLDRDGKRVRKIIEPADSDNKLYPMPATGIQTDDGEIIYSTITFNYKDYAINKLTIN